MVKLPTAVLSDALLSVPICFTPTSRADVPKLSKLSVVENAAVRPDQPREIRLRAGEVVLRELGDGETERVGAQRYERQRGGGEKGKREPAEHSNEPCETSDAPTKRLRRTGPPREPKVNDWLTPHVPAQGAPRQTGRTKKGGPADRPVIAVQMFPSGGGDARFLRRLAPTSAPDTPSSSQAAAGSGTAVAVPRSCLAQSVALIGRDHPSLRPVCRSSQDACARDQ